MNQIKIAQARKNRLAKQQASKEKAEAKKLEAIFELQNKTIQTLHDNLEKSYTELKGSIENITIPEYEQKFTDINNTLVKLIGKLEGGINVTNLKDIRQQGDVTVKNLKDITNKVSVTNLKDIKLDTKCLVKDKTLSELDTTLANIANQLGQLDEKLEPKQKPENFMPIRRVIKVGNRLEFDDSSWGGSRGGSGGSSGGGGDASAANQTDGSQKTQIVDPGGEAATVTGGKLDVNATASLAGDTLPIAGATEAVGVAIVDGSGNQITSFGGGTQYTEDAAAAANPVGTALNMVRDDARAGGLTTTDGDNVAARGNNKGELYVKSTDSDALLTTIDADTSNISTKIDTVAGAVSGSEMQVDVVGALPAGNNNIGDVDVASSALPTGASTSAKQDTLIANTGASTPFVNLSADVGVDTIKGSAGVLCSIEAVNTNAVDCIVVFYDIAGSVTVGVSTISYVLFVPKGDGTNYGASSVEFPNPLNFANAIKYATVTTAFADPATDLVVMGSYI